MRAHYLEFKNPVLLSLFLGLLFLYLNVSIEVVKKGEKKEGNI
jgi:predicted permease